MPFARFCTEEILARHGLRHTTMQEPGVAAPADVTGYRVAAGLRARDRDPRRRATVARRRDRRVHGRDHRLDGSCTAVVLASKSPPEGLREVARELCETTAGRPG
jgi:hypothetical protein